MATLKVCSINCEWMNHWFTSDADGPPAFLPEFSGDGKAPERLAGMIEAIGAEVLALQEAPSRVEELELFVSEHLGGDYEFILSDDGGAQKLAVLFKPGAVESAQLTPHTDVADLIDQWEADVDGDAVLDGYSFTRSPLAVDLDIGGHRLQVIVAHLKSNFINEGKDLWDDPARRQEFVIAALRNRRRISAEGMRVRGYLDRRLAEDPDAAIVVLGDLNDGPGLDYFEGRYLTHNVTDIIVGSAFAPERLLSHAQHDMPAEKRYTAVFEDFVPEPEVKHLLLDHVMLSPGLTGTGPLVMSEGSGAVYHAEFDDHVVKGGEKRNDRPTDHRPVGVELTY